MLSITGSREKFFVENLLYNCNGKIKKDFSDHPNQLNKEEEQEGDVIESKKPNLKFGIDNILKEDNKSNLIPSSGSSQSQYDFNLYSVPVYYGCQYNPPFNPYFSQNDYISCAFNNGTIASNRDGNYNSIQSNYNLNSYYNQSDVRIGDHSANRSVKSKKAKWNRAVFSNLQRKGLEREFEVRKYIGKPERKYLAERLALSDSQVKVWFQNRRMKWRHSKEFREEMSKTSSNKEQQLLNNFPVNKTEENTQIETKKCLKN